MAETQPWSVTVKSRGPGGNIFYKEGAALLTFDWEFGATEVVVMIWGPHREDWNQALPWASGRKEEILNRVAAEVLAGPGKGCEVEFDLEETAIYLKLKRAQISQSVILSGAKRSRRIIQEFAEKGTEKSSGENSPKNDFHKCPIRDD